MALMQTDDMPSRIAGRMRLPFLLERAENMHNQFDWASLGKVPLGLDRIQMFVRIQNAYFEVVELEKVATSGCPIYLFYPLLQIIRIDYRAGLMDIAANRLDIFIMGVRNLIIELGNTMEPVAKGDTEILVELQREGIRLLNLIHRGAK